MLLRRAFYELNNVAIIKISGFWNLVNVTAKNKIIFLLIWFTRTFFFDLLKEMF